MQTHALETGIKLTHCILLPNRDLYYIYSFGICSSTAFDDTDLQNCERNKNK